MKKLMIYFMSIHKIPTILDPSLIKVSLVTQNEVLHTRHLDGCESINTRTPKIQLHKRIPQVILMLMTPSWFDVISYKHSVLCTLVLPS